MASACAINAASSSPDALLWPSPRLSFSRDLPDQPEPDVLPPLFDPSTSPKPASDFEFHLHESGSFIPADELFANGKLVPLQPSSSAQPVSDQENPLSDPDADQDQDPPVADSATSDLLAPSPRAPMCTSRWKDLLRLKRAKGVPVPSKKTGANQNPNPRALRFLMKKNANLKASSEQSMSSPLLPSGSDQEEKEKPESSSLPPKIRLVRPVPPEEPNSESDPIRPSRITAHLALAQPAQQPRTGPSADSPRLNAAGKVVFTGLERSSSSPGSFTGGPRVKYRGIERSYSANVNGVRIAPVLNVPVCSLRGSRKSVSVFGFERIFKGERRERGGSSSSAGVRTGASANATTTNKGKNEGES